MDYEKLLIIFVLTFSLTSQSYSVPKTIIESDGDILWVDNKGGSMEYE